MGIETEATARRYDLAAALVVALIAGFLRIYLIWHPAAVVFDEVHFGKFASFYVRPLGRRR